jgi:hypothetical protein
MSTQDKNFQAIGDEICAMSEADQAMRKSGVWDSSLDVKHTLRMQQIVAAIGWPTISKVGERLVQHADHVPYSHESATSGGSGCVQHCLP